MAVVTYKQSGQFFNPFFLLETCSAKFLIFQNHKLQFLFFIILNKKNGKKYKKEARQKTHICILPQVATKNVEEEVDERMKKERK